MTGFIPYDYRIRQGRDQPMMAGPSAPMQPSAVGMIPRAREVDLSIIAGTATPDPDTIYVGDYFLFHPLDESFQQMFVSGFDDRAFDYLSIQLIQKSGQSVVSLQQPFQFQQVLIDPRIIDTCGPWGTGPVFLRVATKGVVEASIYVTVYTLTTEMS